jgi:hypothetical protein
MAIRITQIGNEVWVINPSNLRVTQIGNEIWVVSASGNIRVTQIGVEVFRTVAGLPLTITGHADGVANVYAMEAHALPTQGNADGYATVHMSTPFEAPIIAFMGI